MVCRYDGVIGRDKDYLNQDSVKPGGWQKFLDKVHRNGIPWSFRDRELLERSIELVELLYISLEAGLEISAVN